MDLINRFFKIPVKRQITAIFIIISALLIILGILNYKNVLNYQNNINYIHNSSIEHLVILNRIESNLGLLESSLLRFILSPDPKSKKVHAEEIHKYFSINSNLFRKLDKSITSTKARNKLSDVIKTRKLYLQEVLAFIANPNRVDSVNPYLYEKENLRPLFDLYQSERQKLSEIIIEDAEKNVVDTLKQIGAIKRISNFLIITGIIVLLIMTFLISRIVKKLQEDYLLLKKEIDQKQQAKFKIQQLNEELREINKAKDEVFSVISHDLRSPVNGLISSSRILLNNLNDLNKNEVKQFSEVIFRTSEKMLDQLNNLVNWAQSQKKKVFNPEKLQLHHEAFMATQLLKINADQKDITILNKIPEDIFVFADPNMIVSIFQNILSNSIKFTPSGGSIILTGIEKETEIEITVKDTGIGITPEIKSQLFSRESPISTSGTKQESGSGLGLLLVNDFIEKHGGIITVDSEPGKGTTFRFTIKKNRT